MIVSTRAGHSSRVLPKNELGRPTINGVQVRVLVENVYNGTNHKALPKARVGDIITVANGAYAQDLIASGMVTTALQEDESAEAPLTVTNVPAGITITVRSLDEQDQKNLAKLDETLNPQGFPWDFMEAAGLNNQQAQALYEAGFTSVAVILKRFTDEGTTPFKAIKGIGDKTTERLVGWAAEQEHDGK